MRIQSCLIVPMLGVKPIFIMILEEITLLLNEAVTDTHIKEVLSSIFLSFLGPYR